MNVFTAMMALASTAHLSSFRSVCTTRCRIALEEEEEVVVVVVEEEVEEGLFKANAVN